MDSREDPNSVTERDLFEEYESMIKSLQNENNFYKHEQEKLRTEVQQVVEENKTLRTQLKDELSDKKYLSTYKFSPNDEVINLQEQIKIIVKEKNAAIDLFHETQQEVDRLEQQLLEGSQETQAKEYLTKFQELEKELTKQRFEQFEKEAFNETISEQKENMNKILSQNRTILGQVDRLQIEIEIMEEKLSTITICRDELQATINASQNHITELEGQNITYLETIMNLKEENQEMVLIRKQLEDEIMELKQSLNDLISQAVVQVDERTKVLTLEYELKLQGLMSDIQNLEKYHVDKCQEAEKLKQANKKLEAELEGYTKPDEFEPMEENIKHLKAKLKSTLERLIAVERENVEIKATNSTLRYDISLMSDAYQRDIEVRMFKETDLTKRMKLLQEELYATNKTNIASLQDCNNLNHQIKKLEEKVKKYKKQEQMYLKLSEQLQILDEEHLLKSKFLESHVELQSDLNQKWRTELYETTSKFRHKMNNLQKENAKLRQINNELQEDLVNSKQKVQEYIQSVHNIQ